MSIESKLQALLTASNATTGETDSTLTDAVQRLVDGYGGGGGLPDWIEEMDVVEYIPTADTNEEKSFAINMTATPDLIIVASNITTKTASKQFVGLIEHSGIFGIGDLANNLLAMSCTPCMQQPSQRLAFQVR